jgi:hypothetical protein
MTGYQLNALCTQARHDVEDGLPRRIYQLADYQSYYDYERSRVESRNK